MKRSMPISLLTRRSIPMSKHVCRKSGVCICYKLALEPNPKCPVHGVEWPPRCGDCGKFMEWPYVEPEMSEEDARRMDEDEDNPLTHQDILDALHDD